MDAVTGDTGRTADDLDRLIADLDASIVTLWQARAAAARELGELRVAAGRTRSLFSEEQAVFDRYCRSLGTVGARLVLLMAEFDGKGGPAPG